MAGHKAEIRRQLEEIERIEAQATAGCKQMAWMETDLLRRLSEGTLSGERNQQFLGFVRTVHASSQILAATLKTMREMLEAQLRRLG